MTEKIPIATRFCESDLQWAGCYKGSSDLLVPDAYSHPAKMAVGLCFRLMEHLEELGLLRPGDCVVDAMAGTGMTGLVAAVKGYPSILVELEDKFCGYIRQNKEALEKRLGHAIEMTVIQGDSRHLSGLLQERGLVGVVSPPFLQVQEGGGISARMRGEGNYTLTTSLPGNLYQKAEHGDSPGQIGNLPEGPARIGLTSPPYEDSLQSGELSQDFLEKHQEIAIKRWGLGNTERHFRSQIECHRRNMQGQDIGSTPNQIGQERGGTYWEAMRDVYTESLKCCDVLAVVVKDPTRKGKLHPLGQMTFDCLEACGWRVIDYHQAVLFTETEQGHLFEGKVKRVKGRLSFFKRLSYQKGSPVASYEHVIIAVNPNGRRGFCQIVSPPYGDMSQGKEGGGIDWAKRKERFYESNLHGLVKDYGHTPGQIGNLPDRAIVQIVSPPYALGAGTGHNEGEKNKDRDITASRNVKQYYSAAPANISNSL